MRTIHVVTHPEATHHVEGLVGGWHDSRLTAAGARAAVSIAEEWLDERFRPPPVDGERMEHDDGVPGAETKEAFSLRIYAVMDDILRSASEHQVVVTHGFAVTFVVASWITMPVESLGYVDFRVAPGSITVLREDDFFHNRQVDSLGDTRHLVSRGGRSARCDTCYVVDARNSGKIQSEPQWNRLAPTTSRTPPVRAPGLSGSRSASPCSSSG